MVTEYSMKPDAKVFDGSGLHTLLRLIWKENHVEMLFERSSVKVSIDLEQDFKIYVTSAQEQWKLFQWWFKSRGVHLM